MKKQTTLFLGNNLTAAPAVHDFVVDGLYAGLSLSVFNLTGTTPTLQVTATALYEDGFDRAQRVARPALSLLTLTVARPAL
jgi:hypothetical protein